MENYLANYREWQEKNFAPWKDKRKEIDYGQIADDYYDELGIDDETEKE